MGSSERGLYIALFISVWAAVLWLSIRFTPWLDGLSFNPWWLMVGVVLLGSVLGFIFQQISYYDLDDEAYSLVYGPAPATVSVGAFIALGMFLKPGLESLPFNPWWLTVLTAPLLATLLLVLVNLRSSIPFSTTRFSVTLGLALGLTGIAAAGIFFLLWVNPFLHGLSYSPWWLVMPAGALSLSFALFGSTIKEVFYFGSGIGKWAGNILNWVSYSPIFLILTPLGIATSLAWGIPVVTWLARSRRLWEMARPGGAADRGPWVDVEIDYAGDDRFGYNEYATVLTNQAIDARTPLVIGVFGSWGSGKSSLMRLMESLVAEHRRGTERNGRDPTINSLWINAWELNNRGELWNSFLQSLLTQINKRLNWERRLVFSLAMFQQRIQWGALMQMAAINSYKVLVAAAPVFLSVLLARDVFASSNAIVQVALDPITGGGASVILGTWLLVRPAVQGAKDKVTVDLNKILRDVPYEEQINALQQLQHAFRAVVKAWVGETGRIFIFIDDLDRCAPEQIPEVIEALKLFATTEGCIYVVGMDHLVVRDAIMKKYGTTEEAGIDYLEKIVQIPFYLPPLENIRIESFVANDYPDVVRKCAEAPKIFSLGLEPNPRKVKRVLNIYRTFLELGTVRYNRWEIKYGVNPELLAKMVVINERHNLLHQELVKDAANFKDLDQWAKQAVKQGNSAGTNYSQTPPAVRLVPENQRGSLAAMLAAGNFEFAGLNEEELRNYVYILGAYQVRPGMEERDALLGTDDRKRDEVIHDIMHQVEDPKEQAVINSLYLERLHLVADPTQEFNNLQMESSSKSIFAIEFDSAREEFEPVTVKIPGGDFLIGYDESDRQFIETQARFQTGRARAEDRDESLLRFEGETGARTSPLGLFTGGGGRREGETEQYPFPLTPFYISKYPVTNALFLPFAGESGLPGPEASEARIQELLSSGQADMPVVDVSWAEAQAYCEWLSQKSGRAYRLLREEEWEIAARANLRRRFPWGNVPGATRCNMIYRYNPGNSSLSAVSRHDASGRSPYLVADMIGNAWEWTVSAHSPNGVEKLGAGEDHRVVRGGSFVDTLGTVLCATSHSADAGQRYKNVGFRVALDPPPSRDC
ncbi:MAG: hypothetical protein BZY80_06225 [SAR202 cluster bacterium Io17-Chloro-G2]|nr:MAG: hypothetical protein BZY80_06225 [SAR202 cluster bacterium Io17-Chloro-G2]